MRLRQPVRVRARSSDNLLGSRVLRSHPAYDDNRLVRYLIPRMDFSSLHCKQ